MNCARCPTYQDKTSKGYGVLFPPPGVLYSQPESSNVTLREKGDVERTTWGMLDTGTDHL